MVVCWGLFMLARLARFEVAILTANVHASSDETTIESVMSCMMTCVVIEGPMLRRMRLLLAG